MDKNPDAFRTISEVADDLDLPQHVLRFWESRFPQIKPLKRAGGRRFYRPTDVQLLITIKSFLYNEGYTIKGVQRLLKDQGVRGLTRGGPDDDLDGAVSQSDAIETGVRDESLQNASSASSFAHDEAGAPVPREAARLLPEARDSLVAALGVITACEDILRAARRATP